MKRGRLALALIIGGVSVACGTLGPPVPPEYVGVGPLVERERLKEKAAAKKHQEENRAFSAEEAKEDPAAILEGVVPPPLYPVGTR